MTIDGIVLSSIVDELSNKLTNGRVQKINQINKHLLIFTIYSTQNYKLLISSDSQAPRIHITSKDFKNPQTPTNFAMLLRKHLNNSRIKEIKQNQLDRTVEIYFETRNELGIQVDRKLSIDLMGKHSNIVLQDENNKVLDAITRVSHDMSRVRAIYPGTIFENFDTDKIDIYTNKPSLFDLEIADNMQTFKIFYTFLTGFSPVIGRELSYKSDIDPKMPYGSLTDDDKSRLQNSLHSLIDKIRNKDYQPNLIYRNDNLIEFYAFHLKHLGNDVKFDESISNVLDNYFIVNTNDDSLNQSRNSVIDNVKKIISKRLHKLDLMNRDRQNSENYDDYRIEGDILSANTHMIKKGMKNIELLNYYTNDNIEINLDERKTPWQNIELKYKNSKRLKKTFEMLTKSIPIIDEEVKYLNDIIRQLTAIETHDELSEIRQELYDGDYIRSVGKHKKKNKDKPSRPYRYETNDGSVIFVGKNNKQNEQLTLREANKEDLFFHIKDLPGSHVIMKNSSNSFSDEDIEIAGYLAAYHSKYSDEKYLDVDYTEKKNVFKNKGAKPGMVYYNDFNTLRVNLEEKPVGYKEIL